jgi:hypothetical protein
MWLLQQVSLLSHRFRTVLMTLGAVNQVSTEIQVTTAACELHVYVYLITYDM